MSHERFNLRWAAGFVVLALAFVLSTAPTLADPPTIYRLLIIPADFPSVPGTLDFDVMQTQYVDPLTAYFATISHGEVELRPYLVRKVSRLPNPRACYDCDPDPARGACGITADLCTAAPGIGGHPWNAIEPMETLIRDGYIARTAAGLKPPGTADSEVFDGILFVNALNDAPASCWPPGWRGYFWVKGRYVAVDTPHYYQVGYASTYLSPTLPGGPCEISWAVAAHETGHMVEDKLGSQVVHPAGYDNNYELMDAGDPCSPGIFNMASREAVGAGAYAGFAGWVPDDKIREFVPADPMGGGTEVLAPIEVNPASTTAPMGLKVLTSTGAIYWVECRARDRYPNAYGCPSDGVLILQQMPPGTYDPREPGNQTALQLAPGYTDATREASHFLPGQEFVDPIADVKINVGPTLPGGDCTVTTTYGPRATDPVPDVAITPWLVGPMYDYETVDIWVDSECNGYESDGPSDPAHLKYGRRPDGTVIGNGDDPCLDHNNRVYARIRNLGDAVARDVAVRFEVTQPLGVGPGGPDSWALFGTATSATFPGLAAIAPDSFVDVYVDWMPSSADAPVVDGTFNFHSCIRVKADLVAGEVLAGNLDGVAEQENIAYFEARREPFSAPYSAARGEIVLANNSNERQEFSIAIQSSLPPSWWLDVGSGSGARWMDPGEVWRIPIVVQPPEGVPLGESYRIQVSGYRRDVHLGPDPLTADQHNVYVSGADFEARTVLNTTISSSAAASPLNSCQPQAILVSGCLTPPAEGEWVNVDYHAPSGTTIARRARTNAAGCFADNLSQPSTGDWTVRAFFQGRGVFGSVTASPIAVAAYSANDHDCDTIPNPQDNCPRISNPSQKDLDQDGHGDECDCAPADPGSFEVPARVSGLILSKSQLGPDYTQLSWKTLAGQAGSATHYDAVTGNLALLNSPNLFTDATCVLNDISGTSATAYHPAPKPGEAWWFFVRARNACGVGSYAEDSTSEVGDPNARIQQSPQRCAP